MESKPNIFQLFNENQSKDKTFLDVSCGQFKFALDLNSLIEYSGFVKTISNTAKSLPKSKQIYAISNDFNNKFAEASELLKIKQINFQLFLCILSGKRQTLLNRDLFDFYILSIYFEARLLNFGLMRCN